MTIPGHAVVSNLQIFEKTITAAANSGLNTIATVMVAPIVVMFVTLKSVAAPPANFTSGAITAGAGQVQSIISAAVATFASLNGVGRRRSNALSLSPPCADLAVGKLIEQNLVGTGPAAVNFLVTVGYYPVAPGGYLA